MPAGTTTRLHRDVVRRHRPSPARIVAMGLLGAVAWALIGPAAIAAAHASVISTSPAAGSRVDPAPSEVSITFTERVEIHPDSVVVIDAEGTVVSGEARLQGTTLGATLTGSADGWHAVSWYAVSLDGHPVSGAWTFRIGEGDDAAPDGLEDRAAAAVRSTDAARWTYFATQWASTLATAILAGTMFVVLLVGFVPRLVPLALGAAIAAALTSLLAAGANGPYASVGSGWFDGPATDAYLGRAVLTAVVLGIVGMTRPRDRSGDDAPSGPLLIAATPVILAGIALGLPVLTGHASTESDTATMGVMAHLIVAACWLGAIPAMYLLVRGGGEAHRHLARFSRAATWLLAATLVAGSASVLMLTGGITNASAAWGQTLFVKLALVGVAIAAGAWNRWNVVPRSEHLGRSAATVGLRVEAIALVAVIVASVALTHNGPPRDSTGSGRGPAVIDEALGDDVRLQAIIDPARVGINDIHLFVLDAAGMALEVEELTVSLESGALGVGPITQDLSPLGAGHYSGRTVDLGIAGRWDLVVIIRPDTFSQVELRESFDIAP